ncbi:MAG: hypothetical protein HKN68_05755 [Saprospiraceae bacterium]|nr:hypothetical protein [Saprospiraceae bacterium]
MRKQLILTVILCVLILDLSAQVGIGTTSPTTNLDLVTVLDTTVLISEDFQDEDKGVIYTSGDEQWLITSPGYNSEFGFQSPNVINGDQATINIDATIPANRVGILEFWIKIDLTTSGTMDINGQLYTKDQNTGWTKFSFPQSVGLNKNMITVISDGSTNDPGTVTIDDVMVFYTDNHAIRISDGSEGDGKFLVSDAFGNATWKNDIHMHNQIKDNDGDTYVVVDDTDEIRLAANGVDVYYQNEDSLRINTSHLSWGTTTSTSPGVFATAWGIGTTASGNYATAFGTGSIASGLYSTTWGGGEARDQHGTAWGNSIAHGIHSTAWGQGNWADELSTAFGFGNNAIGKVSTVWGFQNTVSGDTSTAWGVRNTSDLSARKSTVWGEENSVSGELSTAFGKNTEASGFISTAWGIASIASGNYATAFGTSTTASGTFSTAWGSTSKAEGPRSTAWGTSSAKSNLATAWGVANEAYENATAWGIANDALGTNSTAWGYRNTAQGDSSTVWGANNNIIGNLSTAWGESNHVNGINATVWGNRNVASGDSSTVWGGGNTASGRNATAWGTGNTAGNISATTWGNANNAGNDYATAFGQSNTITGYAGTAWGLLNTVSGTRATAWGRSNIAGDIQSTAWGRNNTSNAFFSTAFGEQDTVIASHGTAWGFRNKAAGEKSTVWGELNIASGNYSTAWGFLNESSDEHGVVWGRFNDVTGILATSWGQYNDVSGFGATASGSNNNVSGEHATAHGKNNNASGVFTLTSGNHLKADAYMMTAFGRHNNTGDLPGFSNQWFDEERLFVIGNGYVDQLDFDTITNDAFSVYKGGNVGINFGFGDHPTEKLEVNGNVLVNGDVDADSYITTSSDRRIKKNLKPIEYGLNDILSLKPLSYDQYKYHFPNSQFSLKEGYSPQASIGLIAQEVYDIIPEAVKKPEDENKKIWKLDYTKLIPVLINGIKELNGKNNDLQSENELLKKELLFLKSQFADLDDRLSKAGL